MQTLTLRPTGYGLWVATLRLPDGREVMGGGLSPQEAEYRARLKANQLARETGQGRATAR